MSNVYICDAIRTPIGRHGGALSMVRPDDLARVNQAFFHVNAVVSVGLFLVGTLDLLVS